MTVSNQFIRDADSLLRCVITAHCIITNVNLNLVTNYLFAEQSTTSSRSLMSNGSREIECATTNVQKHILTPVGHDESILDL